MRLLPASLAALTVLAAALTGCTDDPAPSVPVPDPSVVALPSASPTARTEGPAADPAQWPDGLTAKLTAVERVPSDWGVDVPKGWVIVRVTVTATNGGADALPIEPASKETQVLYGPNRTEAEPVTSYSYDDPKDRRSLQSGGATQIAAGGSLAIVEAGIVPEDGLGELAVQVSLPSTDGIRDPYTFTGVAAVLKTVK